MKKYLLWSVMFVGVLSMTGCGLIKADIKMSQKKYDEAIAIYQDYLAKKPEASWVRSRLGFAHLKDTFS
ncbi:MAG: tetratricopeptide repeat protein [Desulfobacteraceae bacterium]|nr:tetratricopeptide repeat protein [Desulfobacteraceae bacterium]